MEEAESLLKQQNENHEEAGNDLFETVDLADCSSEAVQFIRNIVSASFLSRSASLNYEIADAKLIKNAPLKSLYKRRREEIGAKERVERHTFYLIDSLQSNPEDLLHDFARNGVKCLKSSLNIYADSEYGINSFRHVDILLNTHLKTKDETLKCILLKTVSGRLKQGDENATNLVSEFNENAERAPPSDFDCIVSHRIADESQSQWHNYRSSIVFNYETKIDASTKSVIYEERPKCVLPVAMLTFRKLSETDENKEESLNETNEYSLQEKNECMARWRIIYERTGRADAKFKGVPRMQLQLDDIRKSKMKFIDAEKTILSLKDSTNRLILAYKSKRNTIKSSNSLLNVTSSFNSTEKDYNGLKRGFDSSESSPSLLLDSHLFKNTENKELLKFNLNKSLKTEVSSPSLIMNVKASGSIHALAKSNSERALKQSSSANLILKSFANGQKSKSFWDSDLIEDDKADDLSPFNKLTKSLDFISPKRYSRQFYEQNMNAMDLEFFRYSNSKRIDQNNKSVKLVINGDDRKLLCSFIEAKKAKLKEREVEKEQQMLKQKPYLHATTPQPPSALKDFRKQIKEPKEHLKEPQEILKGSKELLKEPFKEVKESKEVICNKETVINDAKAHKENIKRTKLSYASRFDSNDSQSSKISSPISPTSSLQTTSPSSDKCIEQKSKKFKIEQIDTKPSLNIEIATTESLKQATKFEPEAPKKSLLISCTNSIANISKKETQKQSSSLLPVPASLPFQSFKASTSTFNLNVNKGSLLGPIPSSLPPILNSFQIKSQNAFSDSNFNNSFLIDDKSSLLNINIQSPVSTKPSHYHISNYQNAPQNSFNNRLKTSNALINNPYTDTTSYPNNGLLSTPPVPNIPLSVTLPLPLPTPPNAKVIYQPSQQQQHQKKPFINNNNSYSHHNSNCANYHQRNLAPVPHESDTKYFSSNVDRSNLTHVSMDVDECDSFDYQQTDYAFNMNGMNVEYDEASYYEATSAPFNNYAEFGYNNHSMYPATTAYQDGSFNVDMSYDSSYSANGKFRNNKIGNQASVSAPTTPRLPASSQLRNSNNHFKNANNMYTYTHNVHPYSTSNNSGHNQFHCNNASDSNYYR